MTTKEGHVKNTKYCRASGADHGLERSATEGRRDQSAGSQHDNYELNEQNTNRGIVLLCKRGDGDDGGTGQITCSGVGFQFQAFREQVKLPKTEDHRRSCKRNKQPPQKRKKD